MIPVARPSMDEHEIKNVTKVLHPGMLAIGAPARIRKLPDQMRRIT